MPRDKDFKRIVRRRMAGTGEPYTAARTALDPEGALRRREIARWLEALGDPEQAAGFAALQALPAAERRRVAVRGLERPSWRVRRSCCRLLGDLPSTPASTAALERRLEDPHPLVRRAAMDALSGTVDVPALFARMASDSSRRVRSTVFNRLTWPHDKEPWTLELARRFAEDDPSAQIRGVAGGFLAELERRRRTNELRGQLPPDLRAKTERHPGQWVAVAGGRIVGVGDPRAFRHARRTWPDTTLYWVAPGHGVPSEEASRSGSPGPDA
jgi:HEAT repeats